MIFPPGLYFPVQFHGTEHMQNNHAVTMANLADELHIGQTKIRLGVKDLDSGHGRSFTRSYGVD